MTARSKPERTLIERLRAVSTSEIQTMYDLTREAARELEHAEAEGFRRGVEAAADLAHLAVTDTAREYVLRPLINRIRALRAMQGKEQAAVEAVAIPGLLPFEHTRSCPKVSPGAQEYCTCGLDWRVRLATELTMHNAWRKRAIEAETALADVLARGQT